MKQEIYTRGGIKEVKITRCSAVKAMCMDCSGFEYVEVKNCKLEWCPLHPYRIGTGNKKVKLRNKAIKDYCRWCMDGQTSEIAKCVSPNCPLFNFRGYNRMK